MHIYQVLLHTSRQPWLRQWPWELRGLELANGGTGKQEGRDLLIPHSRNLPSTTRSFCFHLIWTAGVGWMVCWPAGDTSAREVESLAVVGRGGWHQALVKT
eukprot:764792-Hanusia_phi.AAC.1